MHIAIIERQPVYVLGTVRNAGTFKHMPGMTVLQALADAGGIPNSGATPIPPRRSRASARRSGCIKRKSQKLDRLLILKKAQLVALRENSYTIAVPPSIEPRLAETRRHRTD